MKQTFRSGGGRIEVVIDGPIMRIKAPFKGKMQAPVDQVVSAYADTRGLGNSLGVLGGARLNLVGTGGVIGSMPAPGVGCAQQAAEWITRFATERRAAARVSNYGVRSEDGRWWWDGAAWQPVPDEQVARG